MTHNEVVALIALVVSLIAFGITVVSNIIRVKLIKKNRHERRKHK